MIILWGLMKLGSYAFKMVENSHKIFAPSLFRVRNKSRELFADANNKVFLAGKNVTKLTHLCIK